MVYGFEHSANPLQPILVTRNLDISSEHLIPAGGILHLLHEPLVHKDFSARGKRLIKIAPFKNLHTEDIEPVLINIIGIPDVEQLPVLSRYRNIVAGIAVKRILVGESRVVHIGKRTHLRHKRVLLFVGRLREAYHCDVSVVKSEVCIGHLVILQRNHANHDREERDSRELHGQQTEFPSAPALAVVPKCSGYRNPIEKMCRHNGVYKDEHDNDRNCQNQRPTGKERGNVCPENLLHSASECKDEDGGESAGKQCVDERLREHHSEHLTASASETLAQSHLAAAGHRR